MDVAYARGWSLGLDLRLLLPDAARSCSGDEGDRLMPPRTAVPRFARRRPRLLGPEPRPQPPRARRRRGRRWSATCATGRARARSARRYPARRARRPTSTTSSPTPTSTPSRSRRRSPRTIELAAAALEAGKHVFVEKPLAASSARGARADRARASARARADAGPHVPLQPAGRARSSELIESRRARRDLLHLDEPREPRPPPARRQRRLGSRPARLLDPPLLARRDAGRTSRALSRGCVIPDTPDVAFINLEFPSGTIAHVELVVARAEQAAPDDDRRLARRWSSTTTRAPSRCASSTRASMLPDPETFGEYQLTLPHRRHRLAARRRGRAARARAARTSARAIRTGSTPRSSARARARGRPDDRGGRRARSPPAESASGSKPCSSPPDPRLPAGCRLVVRTGRETGNTPFG